MPIHGPLQIYTPENVYNILFQQGHKL